VFRHVTNGGNPNRKISLIPIDIISLPKKGLSSPTTTTNSNCNSGGEHITHEEREGDESF